MRNGKDLKAAARAENRKYENGGLAKVSMAAKRRWRNRNGNGVAGERRHQQRGDAEKLSSMAARRRIALGESASASAWWLAA